MTSPLNSPEDPPPGSRAVWPAAPAEGASFTDEQGVRWRIRSITRSEPLADFYLVHLRFTLPSGVEGSDVFGPSEFAALVRERGLRPDAPDA